MPAITSTTGRRFASACLVGAVVGAATLIGAGAGAASASLRDETILYSCNIPLVGTETLTVDWLADIPDTAVVGSPVPIHASIAVRVPHEVYDAFTPFGTTQLDGTVNTAITVHLDGNIPPDQQIPVNGSFRASIPVPSGPDLLLVSDAGAHVLTFNATGVASVAAGQTLQLVVTPRDATGEPTILGTLDIPCQLVGDPSLGTIAVS